MIYSYFYMGIIIIVCYIIYTYIFMRYYIFLMQHSEVYMGVSACAWL